MNQFFKPSQNFNLIYSYFTPRYSRTIWCAMGTGLGPFSHIERGRPNGRCSKDLSLKMVASQEAEKMPYLELFLVINHGNRLCVSPYYSCLDRLQDLRCTRDIQYFLNVLRPHKSSKGSILNCSSVKGADAKNKPR